MKNRILLIFIFVYMLSQSTNAQITFQKVYGGTADEVAYSVDLTSGGGFIVGGSTSSSGNGGTDALIIKLDQNGNIQWNRTFGGTLDDEIRDVHQTSDGGYITCGITKSYGSGNGDIFICKLDATGTILWMKTLGQASNDGASGVIETFDHNYVISGYIGNGSLEIAITKYDINGNLLWQKGFQGPSTTVGGKITELPNGDLMATGYVYLVGAGMHDICLLKTDASGNFKWSKVYGTVNDEGTLDIHFTPSGKIIISGESHFGLGSDNIVMMEMDTAGTVLLTKYYGNTGKIIRTFSTDHTSDGGFVSQIYDYTNAFSDMGIIKTDALGNIQWCYYYGGADEDRSNYVVQTTDHGYILVGYAKSYGNGAKDIYIVKTDSNGYTGPGCQTSYAMGTGNYPAAVNPFTPSFMSPSLFSNITATASSATLTILPICVNPPVVDFFASDTIICEGSCINFTDTSTNNPTSWQWSFLGASTDSSNTQYPSAICYNTPGTYDVTLIVSNYSGSDTLTKTGYIIVDPVPVADITGDTVICEGQSDTLTATGGGTYYWSNGLNTSTIIVNPVAPITYTVSVTNGVCPPAVDSITVSISQLPTPDAGSNDTICVGQTAFINATGTGSYAWTPTTGLSCTICPNPQATPSITTTYTITLTQGTCTASDAVVITVLPAIQAEAGTDIIICKGDSTQLHATGGTAYSWNPGGATVPNPIVAPSATTTYTVTVSNEMCNPATDTVTVIVDSIPNAEITGDTIICSGTYTNLTASGGNSYYWSNTEITPIIAVNPLIQITYMVTVTNLVCTDTSAVTVHVINTQEVDAGNDTTILLFESVQINANGGTIWTWTPETGLSCYNCSDPIASPLVTTTYHVIAIDSNGCASSDSITVTVDINCGAVYVPSAFSPNGDNINDVLYMRGICIEKIDFMIYDRWGEKVFSSSSLQDGWDGKYMGKLLDVAVFVYDIKATFYNGKTVHRKGSIMLVR